ncbi:unnamed protein product [Calicophoron daubneyi]|uniref:HOOK N-terminal domain-containing protein n=1 Tax=Calicophoron daubneyi TaxID=300641 RepID=A0AAV2U1E1_CALDB
MFVEVLKVSYPYEGEKLDARNIVNCYFLLSYPPSYLTKCMMKHSADGSSESNMNELVNSDLALWAQLFMTDGAKLSTPYDKSANVDLLTAIFQKIDGRASNLDDSADKPDTTVKGRLSYWRLLVQNIRNYYLEVLQEVITMRPPNIVVLSRLPNSARAHQEVDRLLLFLLCAAVRCERRDYFIRQIMENLDSEVQAGIMNCIKNFTENPDCVTSFEKVESSYPDTLRVLRLTINQLEDVYLEEIRELLDQLSALQNKFVTLQTRLRLPGRARAVSAGRRTMRERSRSTISLGDPTRGEITTSTPRLDCCGTDDMTPDCSQMANNFANQVVLIEGQEVPTFQKDETDCNDRMEIADADQCENYAHLDSGLDTDPAADLENHQPVGTYYADTSDRFYSDMDKQHLSVELAETRAKLRRARVEIEDQADQMAELQDQLSEARHELGQVKEERARLADAAHTARHWQDEVDALRETAERVTQLEKENNSLKERMHEVDYYKTRCQQLTEDVAVLSDEHLKLTAQTLEGDLPSEKRAVLEKQLATTRKRLVEVEELRNADLDELQKLREELGKLRLEQLTRSQTAVKLRSKSDKSPIALQPIDTGNRISYEVSDTDASESVRENSPGNHAIKPQNSALSEQLVESVSTKLDYLESENRRLLDELAVTEKSASAAAEELAETEARLAEVKRANQILTDKVERLETAANAQADRIRQLDGERINSESEIRNVRETLNALQESSERQISELSRENDILTENMKVLRARTDDQNSADDQIRRLKKENDVLGESAQVATTRLAKAELELNQLRSRLGQFDEKCTKVNELVDERNRLSAELEAAKREIAALREACEKQSELEVTIATIEGECARLRSQLSSERAASKARTNSDAELVRLQQVEEKCRYLQSNLQTTSERLAKVETERESLASKLHELQQKCASKNILHFDQTGNRIYDGDVDDDDEEEVDSGNKTGDSTEETEQFGADQNKRKTFSLPTSANRYRDRRRKSRSSLETELVRLEAETARLEDVNSACTRQLEEAKQKVAENESEIARLRGLLEETRKVTNQPVPPDLAKVEGLEHEIARLKTALSTSEQDARRLRRELRDVQANPEATEAGKTLVEKTAQLETELAKAAAAHQSASKQYEVRIRELEQERSEAYQQVDLQKQTALTLRERLVRDKIEVQRKLAILKQFQSVLERMKCPKDKLVQLFETESTNDKSDLLESLIRSCLEKDLKQKDAECELAQRKTHELQTQNYQLLEALKKAAQMNGERGDGENSSKLLVELKNRVVELERENARVVQLRQNDAETYEDSRNRIEHLEHRVSVTQDQLTSSQSQLAELIATNARLQVENTTLHSQLDSLSGQNSCLSGRINELEDEAGRLRVMVESAHAAETHLTADYYHLQRLHEQLTRDYDLLSQSAKSAKDSQRQLKSDLTNAQVEINQLRSRADEVHSLREALELERGTLKGEAKQFISVREECGRLRAKIDVLTESRDKERADKNAALERAREAQRQADKLENEISQIRVQMANRRSGEQKWEREDTELRLRVQMLSEMNARLERDNQSLVSQLQTLLEQNQELLASALETCNSRVSQEGFFRERLLSLQRQKQRLEDKIIEHYRNNSLSKRNWKRLSLVQRARAALSRKREGYDSERSPRSDTNGYHTIHCLRPQQSIPDVCGNIESSLSPSTRRISQSTSGLIPGSVSIYDRDPDEHDTREFHAFLKRLDSSKQIARTGLKKSNTMYGRTAELDGTLRPGFHVLSSEYSEAQRELVSEQSAVADVIRGSRHPSGEPPKSGATTHAKSPKSALSEPVDQQHQPAPHHYFPHQPMLGARISPDVHSHRSPVSVRSTQSSRISSISNNSKSIDSKRQANTNLSSSRLPVTERGEKQLCEIVTIKSSSDEFTMSSHSRTASDIGSRSSSMRSVNSPNAMGLPSNTGALPSYTRNAPTSISPAPRITGYPDHLKVRLGWSSGCSDDSVTPVDSRHIQWENGCPVEPVNPMSPKPGPPRRSTGSPVNSMMSQLENRTYRETSHQSPLRSRTNDEQQPKVALEVVAKPRLLIEYGDL